MCLRNLFPPQFIKKFRAMLELDQILRSNEINFAVLAALPAIFVIIGISSFLQWGLRSRVLLLFSPDEFSPLIKFNRNDFFDFSCFLKGKDLEGKGHKAQAKRRLLLADVERILLDAKLVKSENN